jgi:di/tripeptidase
LAFIALDGPGLDRIVHRALGSVRMRVTFRGPGGHSWAAFGVPNPAHAVGIATARMAELPLPATPRTALSVVRIGGGHSLNTIPMAAWLELDLRAESDQVLASFRETIGIVLEGTLVWINKHRAPGTAPLVMDVASLGERPSGTTPESQPLVQAAMAATRALGGTPALAAASTDANVAISRGIPGIAIGAGGRGGDAHLLTEWYENGGGAAGIVRCLLVVVAAGEGR